MEKQKASFFGQVYEIVKRIPRGKVMTYGQIAEMLGTRDARKVGWALHGNRDPKIFCHRVVNKDGRVATNYAFEGWEEQKRKLLAEGASFIDEKHLNLKKHLSGTLDLATHCVLHATMFLLPCAESYLYTSVFGSPFLF